MVYSTFDPQHIMQLIFIIIFLVLIFNMERLGLTKLFNKKPTPPSTKSTSTPNIKWILVGSGIFICLLLLIIENSGSISRQPTVPDSQAVIQSPAVSDLKSNTESDITVSPSHVILSRYSIGYDWKRADYQTKRQFCQTVAAAESKEFNHDFTADFYLDALDGFYSSSDPSVMKENINRVVGMTTAVAIGNQ